MVIRTPDHRLRVFVSSTLKELAEERKAVRQAILNLHLAPVMFESGARPYPAQELYQSYLSQSQIFIAIYWQSYGWVGPEMSVSGLEDEYNLSAKMPRLIYIKNPAPDREPALTGLLDRIREDNTSCYTSFSTAEELKELVQNDLALMLSEVFEGTNSAESSIESRPRPPTNVPVPRNSFVDRVEEMAAARDLLQREDIALITLTGPGGTGKSRLALQIGIEMLEAFQDGVYLVRLEPVNNPGLVIPTIAETLGIRETADSRPVGEMLKEFLRDKQLLLLLDNFEQVVEAAPEVAILLEACPRLKIVATSRAPLRLRAEKELPVPPLAVPSMQKATDLSHLSQYAAVELFIQRAQAVRPDFSVTNSNAPAVAEICYRLDGLPLAIELAAARIKLLNPEQLLVRLGHRFDVLHGGTRDLPERQRTLRGAIDWSYNLLTEPEKTLFRRLSIFIGGWTLEAAEAVGSLDGDLDQRLEDILESLIDNNLVIQVHENGDQPRFGMLATIHEYAYERLQESNEADTIHRQHAEYYLKFVKTIEPRIRSAERVRWHQVLLKEFGNIRAVFEWISISGNSIEIGQQIFVTLGILWVTSGYATEGQKWCMQMLSRSDESMPIATHAELLNIEGWIAWAQGYYFSAETSLNESLALFKDLDEKTMEVKQALAMTMLARAMLASSSRDLATANEMYDRSIELFEETGDHWYKALALSWLGDIALYENDRQRAADLHHQSIQLARQQGDPWILISPLMSSGQIAVLDGNLDGARSIFLEVEDILRKTGDQWSLASALNDLGHVSLMEDDLAQASAYFTEVLTSANTVGNRMILLISLTGAAAVLSGRERALTSPQQLAIPELALLPARLCGATLPYVDKPGVFHWFDSKALYEADITRVQSSMDKELWDRAFFEGQNLKLEQAVALALQALKE